MTQNANECIVKRSRWVVAMAEQTRPVFQVNIFGAQELSQALRYFDRRLQRQFHNELRSTLRRAVVPQIKAAAPKGRSGALQRSVRVVYSQSKGLRIMIGRRGRGDYKRAFYASWVIYGSPSRVFRSGPRKGARRTPVRPNKFPFRVLDRLWPDIERKVDATLQRWYDEAERRAGANQIRARFSGFGVSQRYR